MVASRPMRAPRERSRYFFRVVVVRLAVDCFVAVLVELFAVDFGDAFVDDAVDLAAVLLVAFGADFDCPLAAVVVELFFAVVPDALAVLDLVVLALAVLALAVLAFVPVLDAVCVAPFAVLFVAAAFWPDLAVVLAAVPPAVVARLAVGRVLVPGDAGARVAEERAAAVFVVDDDRCVLARGNLRLPLTTSLNAVPGRNAGTLVFFTRTVSPVCGFLAVRAARERFSKAPNPVMLTFSPLFTVRMMMSTRLSTASLATFLSPMRSESASTRSVLFAIPVLRRTLLSRPYRPTQIATVLGTAYKFHTTRPQLPCDFGELPPIGGNGERP